MAINGFTYGTGYWLRRYVMCTCMLLHGGRMALGALLLFGSKSGFTYRFAEDLPRYQYAKVRWIQRGMPQSTWWIKSQQDCLQQCYANSLFLAAPVALASFNQHPDLNVLEYVGWGVWALSWMWENVADGQKHLFLMDCKGQAKTASKEEKKALKNACLGVPPFAGKKYLLWTLCRHPNYFGEWMAWAGLVLAAIPSLYHSPDSMVCIGCLAAMLVFLLRFFYDCLVHWTGAGPAEHFSLRKRPSYRTYQMQTRCFFPFDVPFADHHLTPGWPDVLE